MGAGVEALEWGGRTAAAVDIPLTSLPLSAQTP